MRAHRPQSLVEEQPPPVAGGQEAVPQDRGLDEPPRHAGQRDRYAGLEEPQPRRGGPGTGDRPGQRDHRPVPQVDPVRADPHPAQRGQAGHGGDDAGARRGGDQARRAHRGEDETGRVDGPVAAGEMPGGPGQQDEPDYARGVQAPDLRGRERGQGRQREGQGQRGSDQQRGGVRIGAVIDQRRVARRVFEPHGQRRHRGQDQRGRDAGTPSVQPENEQPQEQGPDQVELFLDGQRPQMIQRWRCREQPERGEVRHVVQDLIPVAGVRDRGQQRQPQRGALARLDHRGRRGDHGQHQGQCRQQAPGPPGPEVLQVQPAQPVVLTDQ